MHGLQRQRSKSRVSSRNRSRAAIAWGLQAKGEHVQVAQSRRHWEAVLSPFLHKPRRFGDDRGWFSETFNAKSLADRGVDAAFVQDNHSMSRAKGTLRGIHFQRPPHAQAKLVRCVRGRIWDMAVDLRNGSPTYGRHVGAELTAANGWQLFVPVGYGHAFVTLEEDCEVEYKVTDFYSPECDGGVAWDDPTIAAQWPLDGAPVLSAKDEIQPRLEGWESPFDYDGTPMMPLEDAA